MSHAYRRRLSSASRHRIDVGGMTNSRRVCTNHRHRIVTAVSHPMIAAFLFQQQRRPKEEDAVGIAAEAGRQAGAAVLPPHRIAATRARQ